MTGAKFKDIKLWFKEGKANGKKYMLVFCDTWDYEDYPVFCDTLEEAIQEKENHSNSNRLMETYNLSIPMKEGEGLRHDF